MLRCRLLLHCISLFQAVFVYWYTQVIIARCHLRIAQGMTQISKLPALKIQPTGKQEESQICITSSPIAN